MILLDRADVAALLDEDALLSTLAEAFEAISTGAVSAPPRGELRVGEVSRLLTMPAHMEGRPYATKLVSLFPGNAKAGLPTHVGLIILMDADTGETLAIMDGEHITAMRTAGAAVLAAKHLARSDSRVMTILGAGVQGQAHLELIRRHFDLEIILVGSRNAASAARLAALDERAVVIGDVEDAVRRSDIVCLCSGAARPLILDAWLRPGQHVSSVGYAPPGGELDPRIAARHKLYVEAKVAFAPAPAGCVELAGLDSGTATELGEVLLGRRPGRESPDEITVYKAMGHAVEDLVVADLVYRRAVERSAGRPIEL